MPDKTASACIDDLIGPKLKAKDIRCPCPIHTPPGTEEPEPPTGAVGPNGVRPGVRPAQNSVLDGKSQGAGDDTISESNHEEAEKIYLQRMRQRNSEE